MLWKVIARALTNEGRIYVPDALYNQLISLFHNSPESNHLGALKTAELVSRDIYCQWLDTMVWRNIVSYKVCHWINALHSIPYGVNMPRTPSFNPWDGFSADVVRNLLAWTEFEFTGILVIVDQSLKMTIYLLSRKELDSQELEHMYFDHVICKHSIWKNIITDSVMHNTSLNWIWVTKYVRINHPLSTTFHLQSHGLTEWQKQLLEQHLQDFCNYVQNNW